MYNGIYTNLNYTIAYTQSELMKAYTRGYIDGINHNRWVFGLILIWTIFTYLWLKYRPFYRLIERFINK
ncbi:MAG: hypothetical protein J7L15_07545 [Clostridiales bacterium]|nr:hypothetical protein [Clostridiales bacterium]